MNSKKEYTSINFLVRVSCMTYNHAPYIEDAMNGFCMQETTFPFVCTIVDDASTDGEPEVIKKYLQEHFDLDNKELVRNEETDDYVMTFAQHKTNRNCYFAVLYLKYNHYSIKKAKKPYIQEWQEQVRYVALCEGDDYWTDSEKLQIQVSYMENNDAISLSHTAFCFFFQERNLYEESLKSSCRIKELERLTDNYIPYILNENYYRIQTCSVVYRVCALAKIQHCLDEMKGMFLMGDTQLWCLLNSVGTIHFFDKCMCIYRVHENSACRPTTMREKQRFRLSCAEMRVYMCNHLNLPSKDKKKFKRMLLKSLIDYMPYNKNYKTIVPLDMNRVERIMFALCKTKVGRMCYLYFEHIRWHLKKQIVFSSSF